MDDPRIYLDGSARREAVRSGWEGFQIKGWKSTSPYSQQDTRWWFWMNGMEGAEKAHKGYSVRINEVAGWT
jgi:hypothetical protein